MRISQQQRQNCLQSKQLFISCIVPVHNESAVIRDFILALNEQLRKISTKHEIIVVDDGSSDDTAHIVRQMNPANGAKMISFSRNFGKEHAIAAGLTHASGDVAIIIDADFQHPIDMIPAFLEQWSSGYDMVYGVRQNRENETVIKRLFTKMFYRLLNLTARIKIPANAGDFRLLDRCVIDTLNQCTERTRFMKGLYAWVGYNSVAVPFKVNDRAAGTSSHHYKRLTELALTGFISFSDIPLRFWGMVGLVISTVSFLSIIYIIGDTWIYGAKVPGYATIMVTLIFFGGMQLLSIGILGEYIARIFREVKKRPPYVIKQTHGINVENHNQQTSDTIQQ